MSEPVITSTRADAVAIITLNRPDRLNALTSQMHEELRAALTEHAADESVRVVMLTGAGRAFCAGQDLTVELPLGPDGRADLEETLLREYNPLVLMLADYPKLTIAALNGPTAGAAVNIALACDVVVAAQSAFLQQAFAKIALLPDAGGTWILPRLVGPKRALALMLTAEAVSAGDAQAMGLVTKVFPDESFAADACAFAKTLAAGPPLAQQAMKQAIRESLDNDLATQLNLEARLQAKLGRSDDFEEGIAAFKEKRAPIFTGR